MTGKNRKLIAVLLAAIFFIISLVGWVGCSQVEPIEISTPENTIPEQTTRIYIGGAVNNPGFYSLKDGDTLDTLIQAAGGITDGAEPCQLELIITDIGEEEEPQKIDINRAPAWMLEALPGIGEAKAQDIISYRQEFGPFQNINELLKVKGIGQSTLENIKELITVAD
jgi:competence protein ComEA